jgi:NAD(P)-dependent dehydrogenase (short-subunit alcohol dehydrogenase family)
MSTMMKRKNMRPMAGRTVVVTGATGGIGKGNRHGLAPMGPTSSSKDAKRTEETAEEIRLASCRKVDAFAADLSSQGQVRRLVGELPAIPRIDVLIKNAGGYWNTRHTTADGLGHTPTRRAACGGGYRPGQAARRLQRTQIDPDAGTGRRTGSAFRQRSGDSLTEGPLSAIKQRE